MSKRKLKASKLITGSTPMKGKYSSFEKNLINKLIKKDITNEELMVSLVSQYGHNRALKKLVQLQNRVDEVLKAMDSQQQEESNGN